MDIQEKADYLAEHLLGWKRDGGISPLPIWRDGSGEIMAYLMPSWEPQNNISQCFEYIIPAMEKRYGFGNRNGFILTITDGGQWLCEFGKPNWMDASADNPATAIVEAAYSAISGQE